MVFRNQEQVKAPVQEPRRISTDDSESKGRSIRPCNFRTAGRISNENARLLTEIHETFAHYLANALETHLPTGVEIKLQMVEQLAIKDYIASIAPFSYLASCSFSGLPGMAFIDCNVDLVFPVIDLLLGGSSVSANERRELSEIEEELMRDLMSLIAQKAEIAWRLPAGSFTSSQRIKSTAFHHCCPPSERVTLVRFEVEVLDVVSTFQFVLPASSVNVLINQSKLDPARKKQGPRHFPTTSLRERILECYFSVAADLPTMRIPVRDLLALQTGGVLMLRTPVKSPSVLTVGGTAMFEGVPVRNGVQKAVQLARRIQVLDWRK